MPQDALSRTVARCRVCGATRFLPVVSLGETPLANSFRLPSERDRPEPRYPLDVIRCLECGLVQLRVVVSPEVLFRDYLYVSSASVPMRSHFAEYARDLTERFLERGDVVVEVGSNDGILLRPLAAAGMRVIGIEPARNVAARANAAGTETWNEFFDPRVAARVVEERGRAAAVIANNVLAHIDDLHGMAAGLDRVLAPDGIAAIEFPYLLDLLENVEYDTIYHEHLSYFAIGPLSRLFGDAGFEIFDARRVAIHGGSLRVFVGRRGARPIADGLRKLVEQEAREGVCDDRVYATFAERVARSRDSLRETLERVLAEGTRAAALGATAKSTTLLSYCGLGTREISYIADATPEKQGRVAPGSAIPIVPEETVMAQRPRYTLLLAWNYADSIVKRFAPYLREGGRFIHPLPLARIIEA